MDEIAKCEVISANDALDSHLIHFAHFLYTWKIPQQGLFISCHHLRRIRGAMTSVCEGTQTRRQNGNGSSASYFLPNFLPRFMYNKELFHQHDVPAEFLAKALVHCLLIFFIAYGQIFIRLSIYVLSEFSRIYDVKLLLFLSS